MKEKRTRRLGHTRTPNPLAPYPYIATAFFTVIFVNTPLCPKPLPSHWFQDQKMQS